ncbi:MAG TPA: hypothetical protein VHX60_15895 [Acidobacteriaceae bacterium]|jgi:hypothetical protein|nr:hypothetical protein [Acidobacteriaceae bacterium]
MNESTHLKRLRATLERIDAHVDPKTGQQGAGAASLPFLRELKAAVAREEAALAAGSLAMPAESEKQEVKARPEKQGRPGWLPARS